MDRGPTGTAAQVTPAIVPLVSQGLFELRKDAITGWWVATMVDRAFDRQRFAMPAALVNDYGDCFNCRIPPGDGIRTRVLKDFAFTVAGTVEEARARESTVAQVTIADARAAGSWRTVVAPPGEHRPLHAVGNEIIEGLLVRCRDEIRASRAADRTQHLQVVQNWGAQAGARTNHLCFDLYDLPQIPHRIGEELGGAARFLIREGECPFCRLVREEVRRPDRLLYADDNAVAFAPWAGRSPFEIWVVPRRHDADFARATDADIVAAAEALRHVLGDLASSLDGPPYNLVLHSAPLKEQVDATYHWHWEIHPRLREIAGLELGTGLPVNPVSPEDAVDELRTGPDAGSPLEHPRR
jgi:UDPglucose--hexose-1-phosphate uridylyltransferase